MRHHESREPERVFRAERERMSLSQRAAGRYLGITQQAVNAIERGTQRLPRDRVYLLPEPMRQRVAQAVIEEHEQAIAELRKHAA